MPSLLTRILSAPSDCFHTAGRTDSRVDGCPFLEQVVNAGEDVRFVVFMDDQVQGRLAFVGGQVHRIFVLLYQDLKAGKLAFLGCEVDGCEALRSAEHRMGAGPTTPDFRIGAVSPCVPWRCSQPFIPLPSCFQMGFLRVDLGPQHRKGPFRAPQRQFIRWPFCG